MIAKASTVLKGPLKNINTENIGEVYHQEIVKKMYIPLATVCFRVRL